MRIEWTRAADEDLESIAAFIAADDEEAATRHVLLLIETVERILPENPAAGRPGRVPRTRERVIPGTKYIVAYRVRHEAMEILRVLHGARRWPNRF